MGRTHIPRHFFESLHERLIGPVQLEPLPRILGQSAKDDERSQLAMDVAVLELLPQCTRRFLNRRELVSATFKARWRITNRCA